MRRRLTRPDPEDIALWLAAVVVAGAGLALGWASTGWQNVILLTAAAVAVLSLRSARKSERQKMTLAFLREYHNSASVQHGADILNRRDAAQRPPDPSAVSEKEKIAVNRFLNQLELLAIGMRNRTYDERIIRDALETSIVRYYQRGREFIGDARRRDGDVREVAYEHFENLARRIARQLKK